MGNHAVDVDEAGFRELAGKDGIVLIDWWAPWCGPCRYFGPIFEAVAAGHPDVAFAKVNTEEQKDLATAFQIRSIPTLMVLRDQVLIYSQPGALAAEALEELIGQARGLDMDEVRKKVQQSQEQGS